MFYIIQNNKIKLRIEQGDAEAYKEFPEYTVLQGEPNSYYDAEKKELVVIPPKPEGNYTWADNKWVDTTPSIQVASKLPDFDNFMRSMRGTDAWNKIKLCGTKSLTLNMASTMLIAALTASKSTIGTTEALSDLRAAMVASTQVSDFTEAEIKVINDTFKANNINIVLTYNPPK